ncbi:hypothetical protein G5I_12096 [Acromyrmex echinatior]|uniref:Uncharacterized protein n=1 Tax=Acromyrmex echinatior TaxID=103372 RepID=F4X1G6_ACREC|nr:hypothetical protein G5I_12096 [Acromyrmex echinatior]
MDMESLYDYEEEQDFYEESPGTRKSGYPIDHRSIKRDVRSMGSFLGANGITDGSGMLTMMAKLLKQEMTSDAEEEGLVPALPGRVTSMQKVPSLSDLSDPESSLGCDVTRRHATPLHSREARRAKEGGPGTHNRRCLAFPVFSRDSTSRFISIDGRGTQPDLWHWQLLARNGLCRSPAARLRKWVPNSEMTRIKLMLRANALSYIFSTQAFK